MEFTEEITGQLEELARQCIKDPSLLYNPKLLFIKQLIEHYGGKVPEVKADTSSNAKCEFQSKSEEPQSESESEESDLELDMTGVIGLYIYLF